MLSVRVELREQTTSAEFKHSLGLGGCFATNRSNLASRVKGKGLGMNTDEVKNTEALPPKVEKRLQDLRSMKEFDDKEIDYCRRTYWNDRQGWHTILISVFNRAKERTKAHG